MKKIFQSGIIAFCVTLATSVAFSQSTKNEEIVIRKNGDSKAKTIVVIDSNSITVNGQPLADYKGDVQVFTRKFMGGHPGNTFFSPGTGFRMDDGNSPRTFLGVLTEKSPKGALIKNIIKGSGAEKAGLQEKDVITRVDDKEILSPDDLSAIVKTHEPGDEVTITFLRNGKKKDCKVTLGKTNSGPLAFNFKPDSPDWNNGDFNFKMPKISGLNDLRGPYFDLYDNDQPRLGLQIQETEDSRGVKILNVKEGSPADKAGLKKDDIIYEVNGEKVKNVTDIKTQVNNSGKKEHYSIKAKRNNSDINFEVDIPKKLKSASL